MKRELIPPWRGKGHMHQVNFLKSTLIFIYRFQRDTMIMVLTYFFLNPEGMSRL
jgi:hypothetical protein